jgi:hypothetical protein
MVWWFVATLWVLKYPAMATRIGEVKFVNATHCARNRAGKKVNTRSGHTFLVVFWLAAVAVLGGVPAPASASPGTFGPKVSSFEQHDMNGDGRPDVAIITATYVTDHDKIVVYDQAGNMRPSDSWQTGTDFLDDVWIFEPGGGMAKLIIRFSHGADGYVAELFDDVDGDGKVSYLVENGRVRVIESKFPTVRVEAQQPWILPGGEANQILHIVVYRPLDRRDVLSWALPHDGRPAYEKEIVDLKGDGIPDYELVRYYRDLPPDALLPRTTISVNIDRQSVPAYENPYFWPYLGGLRYDPWEPAQTIRFFDQTWPPILVDWQEGRIKGVGDFVSRLGGRRLLYNSNMPTTKGEQNVLDFERFGQYVFAGNQNPDMIIRWSLAQAGQSEFVHVGSKVEYPVQVDISWHQQDHVGSIVWDYKLGLAGRQEVPSTIVPFKDFSVRDIPYEQWPSWFTAQDWAYATFVSSEGNGYPSNEALYEWNTVEGAIINASKPISDRLAGLVSKGQRNYILGFETETPLRYYSDIREGFRGEYADLRQQKPKLYFSPIDRKLHLLGAAAGVWNVDGYRRLRYRDLDGDGYVDQWTITVQAAEYAREEPAMSLQFAQGLLLYGGVDRVRLVRQDIPASLFETLPPRDHAEWQALGEKLATSRRDFGPLDLFGIVDQFKGPVTEVTGAGLSEFRPTPAGFRFVLDLKPGYLIADNAIGLPLSGLKPGLYLVTYDGAFRVEPLTLPHMSVRADDFYVDTGSMNQMSWTTVRATLRNTGLRDVSSLPVKLVAAAEGQAPVLLYEGEIAVPGGGQHVISQTWLPSSPGKWRIWLEPDTAKAIPASVQFDDLPQLAVDVQPAPAPEMLQPLQPFDGVRFTWPVALLLGSMALAGLAVLLIILRSSAGMPPGTANAQDAEPAVEEIATDAR